MARIACSPLTWTDVLYEHVLDDVAGAGYGGVEASTTAMEAFARQMGRLRALLEERSLTLTAVPFSATYFERDQRQEELEHLRRLADFLAEVAGQGFVVCRTVPHPARRDLVAGQPPLLPLDPYRLGHLCESLNRYGDLCAGFGLRAVIANRVGSYLEAPDELEAVLEQTEPELVGFAPDIGHWTYAGGDPAALVRAHRERIIYPRLKDFDQAVFEQVKGAHQGIADFVRAGGFKELGAGSLDLRAVLLPLVEADYDGWLCVELELTERTPRESATISREFLGEQFHW
ncbi:MAG TPA: sugar phosphate isomerase/epimerase [Chloroflexota bacterium]|nr:sugar phosphate isomerase/epimerase [Chloroflexota bacterium]